MLLPKRLMMGRIVSPGALYQSSSSGLILSELIWMATLVAALLHDVVEDTQVELEASSELGGGRSYHRWGY